MKNNLFLMCCYEDLERKEIQISLLVKICILIDIILPKKAISFQRVYWNHSPVDGNSTIWKMQCDQFDVWQLGALRSNFSDFEETWVHLFKIRKSLGCKYFLYRIYAVFSPMRFFFFLFFA